MTEQEKNLTVSEASPPAPVEAASKPGLMRGTRNFIENTFASLKGKDLNQAVEEFSSEMTLVAEGLSEDQAVLRRETEQLSARLTLTEEQLTAQAAAQKTQMKQADTALRTLQKQLDKQDTALKAQLQQLGKLQEQLEKLQRQMDTHEKALKKPQKAGLKDLLHQATWLVGLICGAWVLVTLLKLLGS